MALIEFEEYKQKLNNLEPDIDELERAYDLEHAAEEVEELENRASEPGFWDDMEKSQKILQRTKALKDKIEGFHNLKTQWEDLLTLCELAIEVLKFSCDVIQRIDPSHQLRVIPFVLTPIYVRTNEITNRNVDIRFCE